MGNKNKWYALKNVKNIFLYAAVIVVCVAFIKVLDTCKEIGENVSVKVATEKPEIEKTAVRVGTLKEIGEWEFLSIRCDEIVDSVRKGFIKDDALTRVYHGTLRLGVNMKSITKKSISYDKKADSLTVTLPKVTLLDKKFIDEAMTDSYFETGKWSEKERKAMLKKAEARMKKRALTEENLKRAEDNGRAAAEKMFLAMGYKKVVVKFEK